MWLWNLLRAASGGRLGQLSILENNCMQTTASAAGFSTGAALCVTFAALMMLDPEHRQQPWWVVAAFTFTTAMMGVLLAIPIKRLLINQERLPFPTGTAAATTLRGLYSQEPRLGEDRLRHDARSICGRDPERRSEHRRGPIRRARPFLRVDAHAPDRRASARISFPREVSNCSAASRWLDSDSSLASPRWALA
jgi:hypothetical protein